MSVNFPIKHEIHDLTIQGYSLGNIYRALSQNITGYVEEVLLPIHQEGQAEDLRSSVIAPWLNASTWFYFDLHKLAYLPTKLATGSVSLAADPTAERLQATQDKNGTVALLTDVYGAIDTISLPEGTCIVDWDIGRNFKCTLSHNRVTYFAMAHSRAGMEIQLLVVNAGGNQSILWDSLISWPNNTPPTMPVSQAGSAKSILVNLRNVNGVIYGESQAQEHPPVLEELRRVHATDSSPASLPTRI
jgi:hypothetical protein